MSKLTYLPEFIYTSENEGISYSMYLGSNSVPHLELMFNFEMDNFMLEIPNLNLVNAIRFQDNGVSFEYTFGNPMPLRKTTVRRKEDFSSLQLSYIFNTDDDVERAFPFIGNAVDHKTKAIEPRLVNPDKWKPPLEGLNYAEIIIKTSTYNLRRIFDIDEPHMSPHPNICIDLLRHLNSTLLQYETIQKMSNTRMKRLIQTVKPVFMEQATRPPGTFGNENTGGVLYKRGLRNFTAAANTGNARRRTRKQRRV